MTIPWPYRDHSVTITWPLRPRFVQHSSKIHPRFPGFVQDSFWTVPHNTSNFVYRYDAVVTPFPLPHRLDRLGNVLAAFWQFRHRFIILWRFGTDNLTFFSSTFQYFWPLFHIFRPFYDLKRWTVSQRWKRRKRCQYGRNESWTNLGRDGYGMVTGWSWDGHGTVTGWSRYDHGLLTVT